MIYYGFSVFFLFIVANAQVEVPNYPSTNQGGLTTPVATQLPPAGTKTSESGAQECSQEEKKIGNLLDQHLQVWLVIFPVMLSTAKKLNGVT